MFDLTKYNKGLRNNGLEGFFLDDWFGSSPMNYSKLSFKLDIKENEKEYLIEADLPGLKKEEIKIAYEHENLIITTEKSEEIEEIEPSEKENKKDKKLMSVGKTKDKKEDDKKEKDKKEEIENNYIHRERNFYSMQRSMYMPNINPDKIKAKLKDGVLNLTIPKKIKKIAEYKIDIE